MTNANAFPACAGTDCPHIQAYQAEHAGDSPDDILHGTANIIGGCRAAKLVALLNGRITADQAMDPAVCGQTLPADQNGGAD